MIGQVRLTLAGTDWSNLKTSRVKPWSVVAVTLPSSISWARAGANASTAAAISNSAGSTARARQPRAHGRARA